MAMTGGTSKLVAKGTPPGWPGPISLYVYYKEDSQSIENNQTVLSLGMYVTTPDGWYFGSWKDWNGSYIGTETSGSNCKTFDGSCPANTQTRWLVENQKAAALHLLVSAAVPPPNSSSRHSPNGRPNAIV